MKTNSMVMAATGMVERTFEEMSRASADIPSTTKYPNAYVRATACPTACQENRPPDTRRTMIAIDCAGEAVTVNGADARDRVALGSDFFAFEPGDTHISCLGFFEVETRFTERWA